MRLLPAILIALSLAALPRPAAALTDEQYQNLVRSLRESEAFKVRLQAAVVLGRAGGPQAVEPLVGALDDSEVAVRAAAAMALGNLADLRAVAPLVKALDDEDGFVRGEAQAALGKLAGVNALPYLTANKDHRSPRVRRSLAELVARVEGPEAAKALVDFVGDEEEPVRSAAETALLARPYSEANEALREGLHHPNYLVRQRCAMLLGRRHDERALPRLAEIYADDVEAPEVREAARAALFALRDRLDIPALTRDAANAPDKRARAHALALLGVVGGEHAFRACIAALSDDDVYVRGVAALALADIGDKRALPELKALLDRPANVRILRVLRGAMRRLERG